MQTYKVPLDLVLQEELGKLNSSKFHDMDYIKNRILTSWYKNAKNFRLTTEYTCSIDYERDYCDCGYDFDSENIDYCVECGVHKKTTFYNTCSTKEELIESIEEEVLDTVIRGEKVRLFGNKDIEDYIFSQPVVVFDIDDEEEECKK